MKTFTNRSMNLIFTVTKAVAVGFCFAVAGCVSEPTHLVKQLTVLYTNDEHGWMEGVEEGAGAANLYDLWVRKEGYTPDGSFLLLSGGDNWTGPAISTWFEGESMVELMNTMGYDASAVGNHEFDFGLETLEQRASEARYSYLSANIIYKESGESVEDLNIYPHTLKVVKGIRVGIIGLTTLSTPTSTMPSYVRELTFINYEAALRRAYRNLKIESPDLVFVISHVCIDELEILAEAVTDLAIEFMGAGHCNELVSKPWASTQLLGGGSRFKTYAKASFSFDTVNKQVLESAFSVSENSGGTDAPSIIGVVDKWRGVTDEALSEELAYSEIAIDQRDEAFQQAIINAWLIYDPTADVAITNAGGIREGLPAGTIDFGDVFNVLPFSNSIVAACLSGQTIKTLLEEGTRPVFAGLRKSNENWFFTNSGEQVLDNQTYRVLLNSFMYDGGDNFSAAAQEDPNGFDTGIPYRRPFVNWLKGLSTSPEKPLSLGL